jgi:hypothetical protein
MNLIKYIKYVLLILIIFVFFLIYKILFDKNEVLILTNNDPNKRAAFQLKK